MNLEVLMLLLIVACIQHGLGSPMIDPAVGELVVNKGEPVNLHCWGKYNVTWLEPKPMPRNAMITMGRNSSVIIKQAVYSNTGTYECGYTNNNDLENKSIHVYVKDPEEIWYTPSWRVRYTEGRNASIPCLITDPSISQVSLMRTSGSPVPPETTSYHAQKGITIHNVQMHQAGDYYCQALVNGANKPSSTVTLKVSKAHLKPPSITLDRKDHVRIQGEPFEISCTVTSSEIKNSVEWKHPAGNATIRQNADYKNLQWFATSTLIISAVHKTDAGNFTCVGTNLGGSTTISTFLRVVDQGYVHLFAVQNQSQEVRAGEGLTLRVRIEAYPELLDWSWRHQHLLVDTNVSEHRTMLTGNDNRYESTLILSRLKDTESGSYTFYAANSETNASITFNVFLHHLPVAFISFNYSHEIHCKASGYPAPTIRWYQCPGQVDRCDQDDMLIKEDTDVQVLSEVPYEKTLVRSTLTLKKVTNNITFGCMASNVVGNHSDTFRPVILGEVHLGPNALFNPLLTGFAILAAFLLLLCLFLVYKYKQKPKYETRWQIIDTSKGNNYIIIDPTQLPYNEKWEFPRTNLTFGKTLGAGAFGKVLEATAFGLGKEESVLKVAVKMLKPSAHVDEKEALMSELKIMSHLGHHGNIVNLLGACTQGGPVLVITEYCRYGDLLNFLRRKAESIVIKDPVKEAVLESHSNYKNVCLDKKYTKRLSHEGVDSYVEMRPVLSEFGTAQGLIEDDENEDTFPLDLYDLLHFSSQVAQGMAFLASKNCIHRDLAARNILVTHGRVAKICDFGLARDIMTDSNYVVKGNARLPVKWMAPESIFDCIYTVQSDVWSYGILLWEIFSLGKNPYPGILVDGKFYKLVKQGYQMARPDISPLEIYDIMKACWSLEPTQRPTFDQICSFIQKQMQIGEGKDQVYTNLSSNKEADQKSECKAKSEDESCDQQDVSHSIPKSNHYQFC
ncbi:macrophage colony-stimulating factor 1 receptor [Rhinatrema bivittatum]|uniref:macrophage colony-stimulating factor 1 receptor n=1 Tax=Rhinatrema bivittatum TaxID=194408 RepID=UPI00112E6498|nr:macrophage colony-stimulating factor 1 receptor [Rhinatrema bivittatum]